MAFHRGHDHRARDAVTAVGQEEPARIGHALQPRFSHLEQAELAGSNRTGA